MFTYSRVDAFSSDEDDSFIPKQAEAGCFDPFDLGSQEQNRSALSTTAASDPHSSTPQLAGSAMQPASLVATAAGVAPAADAVRDFEIEDSDVLERRELLIYAIPLFRQEPAVEGLVFLPITSWREEPAEYKGWTGAVQERIDKMQQAALDMWHEMKEKQEGSVQHTMYKISKQVVDNLSPEERLMKAIPKNVTKVIIFHPTQIAPDTIMERLTTMSASYGAASSVKAAAAGLMLPLAFAVDVVVIPGPQVLTYWCAWNLYKNSSSATGGQRLTKYIAQQGSEKNVRVNYAGDPRLDHAFEAVSTSYDGVLSEEDIESVVSLLREADLLHPLLELRDRHLRSSTTRQDDYTLLPDAAP